MRLGQRPRPSSRRRGRPSSRVAEHVRGRGPSTRRSDIRRVVGVRVRRSRPTTGASGARAPTTTPSAMQHHRRDAEGIGAEAQRLDLGQAGIAAVADVVGIGRHLRDDAEDELRHLVHEIAAGQGGVGAHAALQRGS